MKWLMEYAGKVWTYDDSRLTASEARVQKRITDGLLPAQADQARMQLDPEAWVSALVIARRRSGLAPDVALDVDADELDLMDAIALTSADLEAERAAQVKRQAEADEPAQAAAPVESEAATT